ncbi:autotransporter secretion outer membrane protein TamA [Sphingomonas laterariae]|uniref:Autotransporter secretion outer membrane protein TamA n=1 Tax=Edaphosphingomonas laterariae TaxID=861865 RepID=A0A239EE29_9SPHN|nr:BamA/TamA family outer membrane protein [Sphingomonas laterariae]SNS42538.1 autotransporter secretion outer membrane protein TamA [Sphingomonas laterariae]
MQVDFRRRTTRSLALATALLVCANPVLAQVAADATMPPPPDGGLDPTSPMQELPDLGIAWPDLDAPDDVPADAEESAEPAPMDGVPPAVSPIAPGAPLVQTAEPAAPTPPTAPPATPIDASAERRYHVSVSGLDGLVVAKEKIRAQFDSLSALEAGDDKDANVAQIDRRAREDQRMLADLLRAHGYYDAFVRTRVEGRGAGAITVVLEAEAGEVYRFTDVEIVGIDAAGDKADALRNAFPVKRDDVVDAAAVTAAQANLRLALGRSGFPFGKLDEAEIVVDHDTRTATLKATLDPGGAKRFGEIETRGRPIFSVKHLGRIARFHPGDPYDSAKVDDFRRALIQTGLVSQVTLTPEPGDTPDTVDMAVALERAPVRTIAGELGYGTGEGVRAEVSWQHRNLISPEGAVTVRGVAGTQEQSLGVLLRRNNFKARDRVLNAQVVASHTERDAYEARTFTIGAALERQTNIIWQKTWTWSLGAELALSDEKDVEGATDIPRRRTFIIAALPTTLAYDGSDDLLNPMRGFRLSARVSPEASFQGSAFAYWKSQVDASAYLPVNDRFTMAGRVRVGAIFGASRDRIAPSRRFYAGGGGSVRGYGYQDIGPRDLNNDPIGGRSLAEFSIEGRYRIGNFGVVPFLDAGNIYTDALPTFTDLRYGAGLGVRYYSSFGPIRVDVGTPLNPQPGDAKVAVYVSLGQAF